MKPRIIALALGVALLTACSSGGSQHQAALTTTAAPPPTTAAPTTTTPPSTAAPTTASGEPQQGVIPNVIGKDLQFAQDTMQVAGYFNLESRDATGQGRAQIVDRNWKVVRQSPAAGTKAASGELVVLTICKIGVDSAC